MSDPVANNVNAMTALLTTLAETLNASVVKNGNLGGTLAQIQASKNAAAASASAAAGSATAAATSAANANTSQTSAAASATSAATSATNASTSAGTASTKATNATSSASAAAGSASSASTSASSAAGYANRAALFRQVSPAKATNWFSGADAGTFSVTASFTAPANGWVFAMGIVNMAGLAAAGFTATLTINGQQAGQDASNQNCRFTGAIYVGSGTAVTITLSVACGSPTQEAASIYAYGHFIPATN